MAQVSSAPRAPTLSRSVWPIGSVEPSRTALRRRISSGERPSGSASRSICISAANSVCGAPKPRKAPFGGVFVITTRERMRTFGQS